MLWRKIDNIELHAVYMCTYVVCIVCVIIIEK
jgi:hypothetical protein